MGAAGEAHEKSGNRPAPPAGRTVRTPATTGRSDSTMTDSGPTGAGPARLTLKTWPAWTDRPCSASGESVPWVVTSRTLIVASSAPGTTRLSVRRASSSPGMPGITTVRAGPADAGTQSTPSAWPPFSWLS